MSVLLHSVLMISGILAHRYLGYTKILYFLVIVGFGIKAGIFPLHLWLPLAHPAAPSNVSDGYVRRHDQDGYLWLYTILF